MASHMLTFPFVRLLIFPLLLHMASCQNDPPIVYSVEEEMTPGVLGNLISDADMDQLIGFEEAKRLKFNFLKTPETDKDYLVVEQDTGIVKLVTEIDREEICPMQDECRLEYDVVVSPLNYFRIIKVILNILDKNDHAPTFPNGDITLKIAESTLPGTTFVITAPQDLDGGEFGIKEQELDADTKVFGLQVRNIANGRYNLRLQLLEHLDRETVDRYELKVIARDGGDPPLEGSLNIHVKIEDSNDNDPQFDPVNYEAEIVENIPIGTSIIKVHAEDRDIGQNGRIRYSFTSQTRDDYGNIFGINAQTGDIFVRGHLDYEERQLFVLTVDAHDQGEGSLTSQANVVIHVLDINDKPPQVSINSLSESGIPEIMEGAPAETFVAHLTVTDNDQGDGGVFNCELRSSDFSIKKLAETEYSIHSLREFDRESQAEYEIPIVCRDYGLPDPLTSITHMKVRIADANDHAPRFNPPSLNLEVIENIPPGAFLLKINATDADIGKNSRLVYRLAGTDSDDVSIDPKTGVISTTKLLDHEEERELNFIVYATDKGEPNLSSSASVHITILDEDDELPRFEKDLYTFSVKENLDPDTVVGKLRANDADSYPHNEFIFALDSSTYPTDFFKIDEYTGEITTRIVLDHETASIYTIIATASPRGNPSQVSECRVIIHVLDENDNSPVFLFPLIGFNDTVELNSHSPAGWTVAKLKAHDPDANSNSDLMYNIIGGNEGRTFSIDSSKGHILLWKDISHIAEKHFRLTVEVKDKGIPQLSDVATLYIVIINSSVELPVVEESYSILQSEVLTIVLAITAASLLVLILTAVAIILFCCARKRHRQLEADEKECQKMLSHNGGSAVPSPVANGNNGVTVIDMRNEKDHHAVCKPLLQNGEATPLTVDLLSNHPIVKQNGSAKTNGSAKQNGSAKPNGHINKFSTFGHHHNGSTPNHIDQRTNYSRTLSPKREYANGTRDPSNRVHFPKEERTSTFSGEYMHYDLVDSDV